MALLSLTGGSLGFGDVPLLDRVDLRLEKGERVALVGRNGSGKSSLLAALAGTVALDDGEIVRDAAVRVGYVPQEPQLDPGRTVFDSVLRGMGEASRLVAAYHATARRLAASPAEQEALLARLHDLQVELEAHDAWTLHTQAERVIDLFGLPADARVESLSGGQRKRLALAGELAAAKDVLLLDEPTNHLDIAAIEWLENLLLDGSATLLFVSHDRRFLDRLATRIVELDRGRLVSHPGRFAEYQARKERELSDESLANARFDKLLAQEEAWIRKGIEARRTRNRGRVDRLERLRAARTARRQRVGQVELKLDAGARSGRLVAELENVTKHFGADAQRKTVVRRFSTRLLRGDRIGIIGPNGAGKTTLLRLILGELQPDEGEIRRGTRLQVAYFDQFRAQLDPEATLADVISPGSEFVEIAGTRRHIASYLADFLFPPQRARSPVKSLSGGERNRLLLARLFARPANVLVLDEPTNDLDIETLELLESLLQDYAGTVFLVSHDRVFLDNVVTQTIAAAGDGRWEENVGGYQDWLDRQARGLAPDVPDRGNRARPTGAAGARAVAGDTTPGRGVHARRARLSFTETRELEALPDRIDALEQAQRELARQLEDPTLYAGGPEGVRDLTSRLAAIERSCAELLARWEALETKRSQETGTSRR